MGKERKQYEAAFKSRVALDHLREAFSDGRKRHERDEAEPQSELYQQIGQLKVELDWVKKKAGLLG